MTKSDSAVGVAAFGGLEATVPSGRRTDRRRHALTSAPLLAPAMALLALLFLGPVIYSFYLGFTNLDLTGPTALHYQWTGLANIRQLLHDTVFHQSLYLTAFYVVGSGVLGTTAVGLVLAMAMQHALAAARLLVGAIVMVCFMLPPITVAIVWYAASTDGGALPALFGSPRADLLDSAPLVMVSAANSWSLAGLAMLLFGAALRNIPREITESALLEDANARQRFFRITLPLLKPTIVTTVLIMTLLSLANFTVAYVMTGGGPGTSTMILPVYSYQQAFQFNHLAYGALIGDVMVVLATILSILYVRVAGARRR